MPRLNPFELWMVSQQLDYVKIQGSTTVLAGLRSQGYNKVADEVARRLNAGFGSLTETARYHRNPTEAEIRFGHGATHYREFKFSECYNPKTQCPKKRLKAKDDGLWYTYG